MTKRKNLNIFTRQPCLKMIDFNNLVENFNELNLTYMKPTPREDHYKISRKKNFMFSEMTGVCLIQVKGLSVLNVYKRLKMDIGHIFTCLEVLHV